MRALRLWSLPYFEKWLLLGVILGIVDVDLSPGRVAVSIEAAGLVDDSTGEGIYCAAASAAQATYVEVGGKPPEVAGMYAEPARPYVEEVKRSRWGAGCWGVSAP
jgi:hypothetical protein